MLRECSRCGLKAWIIDCGHMQQPRPIASGMADGSQLHLDFCEDCAHEEEEDMDKKMTASEAARALRAIPSEARSQASRENGRKGGRPRKHGPESLWTWAELCKTRPYIGNCGQLYLTKADFEADISSGYPGKAIIINPERDGYREVCFGDLSMRLRYLG